MSAELPALSSDDTRRFGRHLVLPEIGPLGQQRLRAARVLLVGAGGLGSPAGLYLAAAGVGTIGIADFDNVDVTNLQRQVVHGTADIGTHKVDSMARRLASIDPSLRLVPHREGITRDNVLDVLGGYDLVLDGADNFPTRYLLNDACVRLGLPEVHGSILRFEGQVTLFDGRSGPCYRCLFPAPPPDGAVPSCAEAGVLGVLPGVVGTLMATEAIKHILGIGESLLGRLLLYDALAMRFRELRIQRDPGCPRCHPGRRGDELPATETGCAPGPDTARAREVRAIGARELAQAIAGNRAMVLLDVREPQEWAINRLPGAVHIPLGVLPLRAHELDSARPVVVYCHHGVRSRRAADWLLAHGFAEALNLNGGIDAWSIEVDPSVPRY